MQSNTLRAAVATRSILFLGNIQAFGRQRGLASATAGRTADPGLHSGDYDDPAVSTGDPQGTENVAKAKPVEEEDDDDDDDEEQHTKHNPSCAKGAAEPLVLPNNNQLPYPNVRSPRLESTAVHLQPPSNNPINYIQKRSISSHTNAAAAAAAGSLISSSSSSSILLDLEKVSCCAGLDSTSWPEGGREGEQTDDRDKQLQEEERVEDEREYYQRHKASPLSEIEFADTRKPITRAMDGTADAGAGRDVIGWKPEQEDTAEEALERATRTWKENAMRGDPDAPHSRVLRALRGESF